MVHLSFGFLPCGLAPFRDDVLLVELFKPRVNAAEAVE
jgi:hypothetical protein